MSKEITKELARELFLTLVRGAAATWAGYDLPDELERCNGVVFNVLNVIDGNTGAFPALDLVVRPHPDDKAFHIEEGQNYYPDGLAVNDDCALHELYPNMNGETDMSADGEPRAFTKTEVRDQVLEVMRSYAHYWATLPGKTSAERCEGLGFSLLNIFDGTTCGLPAFDLVTRPQSDAKDYDVSQGRDYYVEGAVLNADCYLHEAYYIRPHFRAQESAQPLKGLDKTVFDFSDDELAVAMRDLAVFDRSGALQGTYEKMVSDCLATLNGNKEACLIIVRDTLEGEAVFRWGADDDRTRGQPLNE
jgi:hypothetical protein